VTFDPVCLFHGKRWSEHEGGRCLYCCLCFKTLTPDECAVDADGQKWDMCVPCFEAEEASAAATDTTREPRDESGYPGIQGLEAIDRMRSRQAGERQET
jgi:hypothetical protein